MDLLAHSAAAVLATLYAAAYPDHLARLVLITTWHGDIRSRWEYARYV